MQIKPWRTAIHRKNTSATLKTVLKMDRLSIRDNILDYGCGHGYDLNYLKELNFNVTGYDKYIKTYSNDDYSKHKYTKILCFYVLNTIADKEERITVLESILKLLTDNGKVYIAVRSLKELTSFKNKNFEPYNDGVVTRIDTFQKYFSKEELEELLYKNFNDIQFHYIKFNNKTLFIELTKQMEVHNEN